LGRKVGVFGVGAIGSVLVKYLSANTSIKLFCFNRGEKNDIKVWYKSELYSTSLSLSSHTDQELDWLIICLKEYHYKEAIPELYQLIGPMTKIAIFRNGLDLSSSLVSISNKENILETIIDCSVQENELGEYVQYARPKITLPQSILATEFIALFSIGDIEIAQSENFLKLQWEKLIESSSLGSIQALTGQTCSVFEDENQVEKYEELILEGIKVAESEGVSLDQEYKTNLLLKLKSYPTSKGSSMLTDKLAGKVLELDAKIGIIVKKGLANRVDIPTSLKIYRALLT